jgi:hypothetical protein
MDAAKGRDPADRNPAVTNKKINPGDSVMPLRERTGRDRITRREPAFAKRPLSLPKILAGTGGAGSVGGTLVAVIRYAMGKNTTAGMGIAIAAIIVVCGIISALALVYDYKIASKKLDAQKDTEKAEAELLKLREEKYWEMLGKGATEPVNSRHYAELSDAAARYKSADPACPPW